MGLNQINALKNFLPITARFLDSITPLALRRIPLEMTRGRWEEMAGNTICKVTECIFSIQ